MASGGGVKPGLREREVGVASKRVAGRMAKILLHWEMTGIDGTSLQREENVPREDKMTR